MEDLRIEHVDLSTKKVNAIKEWIHKYRPSYVENEITFKILTGLLRDYQNDRAANRVQKSEAKKEYDHVKELKEKKNKVEKQMDALSRHKDTRVITAFVTFNTIEARNSIYKMMKLTKLQRFFSCCSSSKHRFEGKVLTVDSADDPSNILWSNLELTQVEKLLRRLTSLLITVLLFIITCIVVVVTNNVKNSYYAKYPNPNCQDLNPTINDVIEDYPQGARGIGLLECYCLTDFPSRLHTQFGSAGTLCVGWLEDKSQETAIGLLVIFIVVAVNFVIQVLFRALSTFEKHRTITEQLASRILKIFFAQFLNTGIIILFLNASLTEYGKRGLVFQGVYDDLTPLWYRNVGSTILGTMVINIFSAPGVKVIENFLRALGRCKDRSCGFDERKTKQKSQKAYEALYMGSEFTIDVRYAQILNMVFICMLYSSGMPLLYVIGFLQLLLSYFVDKYFVLKSCKKSANFDEKMDILVKNTMVYAAIIHLIFAIWIYGSPAIFPVQNSTNIFGSYVDCASGVVSKSDGSNAKVKERFKEPYSVILVIEFVICSVILVVKLFLWDNILSCYRSMTGKGDERLFSKHSIVPIDSPGKSPGIVADPNVRGSEFAYADILTLDNVKSLIKLSKSSLKKATTDEYKQTILKKLEFLMQLKKDKMANTEPPKAKFVGLYTYDIRENPLYRELYEVEEHLDDIDDN
jgi:hypothetical protein